jgi:hypothetical protein
MGFPICTIGEQLILRRWACSPQCAMGYARSLIASGAFAAGMPSSDYNARRREYSYIELQAARQQIHGEEAAVRAHATSGTLRR